MVDAHYHLGAEKHINRDRNMLMRKNSVRGAIRKSSRQNSMTKESAGKYDQVKVLGKLAYAKIGINKCLATNTIK